MNSSSIYRRVLRRENHAARAVPAITVAVLAILALAYFVTETVLAAVRQHPLLVAPAGMVADIDALPKVAAGILIAAGSGLVVLGVILVILGLSAGRLGRHTLPNDRAAIVVHDEMIASALVRQASHAAGSDPDRALAEVGRRRATVRLTPTSGRPIDRSAVERVLALRLAGYGLKPALKPRVRIARQGKVGA